ncbi:class I SAM-dependent methyltransferase [Caulobacter sp. RL271]|jgi:SAM-dependent methyltransferase|uniref:Class I SAM-dependent methyltransferase n=1 Tax=Caulobacter segnis TaxID=88688 RepID=A0ABY4ZMH2_9CAUL|nr:class I SAM-dependent methyltransferase [Caulobacter segnis]USQ93763.1 class I SAM-dependent methyltransferase [Caulobacter segnis]
MKPLAANSSGSVAYDRATLHFYAAEAPVYAASGRGGPSRRLEAFLDLLQPGARVLELGCGDGRDSEAMLVRGFDVDPTDGCEAMARQAERRLGRSVSVMRFDELKAMNAYDGVWANASLLHVPRSALPGVLSRVFRALRPGGFHVASYKTGDAEGRDGLGRYFNYLSTDALEAAYRGSADWRTLAVEAYTGGDYEGGERPWAVVTARKSG